MEDNDNEKLELFRKKVEIYFKEGNPVHVTLAGTKKFYNGRIILTKYDYFILYDRVLGQMPIFFQELFSIEPQQEGEQ